MNPTQNDIILCRGNEIAGDLQSCITVIKEGQAVNLEKAAAELPKAVFVALKREGGEVVAVGAIKRQRPWYAKSIIQKSGFQFDQNLHELGYVSVSKLHRNQGLSSKVVAKLLDAFRDCPLFATTSNDYMKSTLKKAGFVPFGNEWLGDSGKLSLWIKDANC